LLTLKASTFANCTSRHTDQSLQKSLLSQRREKQKKSFPRFAKIKSADRQSPTDKQADEQPLLITSVWQKRQETASIESFSLILKWSFD